MTRYICIQIVQIVLNAIKLRSGAFGKRRQEYRGVSLSQSHMSTAIETNARISCRASIVFCTDESAMSNGFTPHHVTEQLFKMRDREKKDFAVRSVMSIQYIW